jgi:hypothetical protein
MKTQFFMELESTKVKNIAFMQCLLLLIQAALWSFVIAKWGTDLTKTPVTLNVILATVAAVTLISEIWNYRRYMRYLKFDMVLLVATGVVNILSIFVIANIHP